MELLELVKRAKAGDGEAILAVCRRFTGLVKKYAFQPHLRSMAEEAQSQGWLALIQGIREYDVYSGIPFEGYIESRVKYAVWNLFKKERRRWQQEGSLEGNAEEEGLSFYDRLAVGLDVAHEVETRQLCQDILEAIAVLPEKQKQVIRRRLLEEEGLSQIALDLGMTPQGVYNLQKRGVTRLKTLCSGMYKDIRH